MFFKQIKHHGDNFSYIIADETTLEAIVIDPSFNSDLIVHTGRERGLHVKYVVNTHQHTDHIAGNEEIKSAFNAKIVAHKLARTRKDVSVVDGQVLAFGNLAAKVIHTPGHSPDGICLLVDDKLFTGDTLFVGECGRTDLPGGSASDLYDSLFGKLMKLDDNIKVYPGHDYGRKPHSTIGEEKRTNYTLEKRTRQEFIEFMKEP
jgi:glyoxylase-like metal-dependent hydrolase (beta-lactamase superfamily II)